MRARAILTRKTVSRFVLIAVLGLLMTLFAAPVSAQTEGEMSQEQVIALTTPSVVYVQVIWKGFVGGWEPNGVPPKPNYWSSEITISYVCSGFVVNPEGYVVTAGHCVDQAEVRNDFINEALDQLVDEGVYTFEQTEQMWGYASTEWEVEGQVDGTEAERTVGVFPTVSASGIEVSQGFQALVVDFKKFDEGDVALLKVQVSNPMPSIAIAENDPKVGSEVTSAGYPAGVQGTVDTGAQPSFKTGRISSEQTNEGVPFYEVDAAISGGMSGGPTVNNMGEVVGVNSWGVGDSEAFNFIVATSTVRSMLTRNGVSLVMSSEDTTYREGLDAYFDGEYDTAIVRFEEVLDTIPSHAQAQKYKGLSIEAAKQITTTAASEEPVGTTDTKAADDSSSGSAVPILILIVVLLLVVAAVAVVLFLRRGSSNAAVNAVPAVPGDAEAQIICPSCSQQNEESSKFCSNCGENLHGGESG